VSQRCWINHVQDVWTTNEQLNVPSVMVFRESCFWYHYDEVEEEINVLLYPTLIRRSRSEIVAAADLTDRIDSEISSNLQQLAAILKAPQCKR